jgi:hypothetical protein
MDGSVKFPFLIIANTIILFKNIMPLACTYCHDKAVWLTFDIFLECTMCLSRRAASMNRQILLVLYLTLSKDERN